MVEILQTLKEKLEDKKAEDIKVIDISEISIMTDYFMIVTGNNLRQINAIKDEAEKFMSDNGYNCTHIEGNSNANWVLMDYGDLVIHIFDKEARDFYDLEHIWKGGKPLMINA